MPNLRLTARSQTGVWERADLPIANVVSCIIPRDQAPAWSRTCLRSSSFDGVTTGPRQRLRVAGGERSGASQTRACRSGSFGTRGKTGVWERAESEWGEQLLVLRPSQSAEHDEGASRTEGERRFARSQTPVWERTLGGQLYCPRRGCPRGSRRRRTRRHPSARNAVSPASAFPNRSLGTSAGVWERAPKLGCVHGGHFRSAQDDLLGRWKRNVGHDRQGHLLPRSTALPYAKNRSGATSGRWWQRRSTRVSQCSWPRRISISTRR